MIPFTCFLLGESKPLSSDCNVLPKAWKTGTPTSFHIMNTLVTEAGFEPLMYLRPLAYETSELPTALLRYV